MKYHGLKLFVFLLFICSQSFAKEVKAYLLFSTFNSPEKGPYIETYISVIGNSVTYKKNANGKYQGAIEIAIDFKQNDEIKLVKKYNLLGPEIVDTLNAPNFIDQQRFALPNGTYSFDLSINDRNKSGKPFVNSQLLTINYGQEYISISDIQLIESFKKATEPGVLTKSGYDLIPYVSTYFPENMKKISFYAETYNTLKVLGENERFVTNYYVEQAETQKKMSSFNVLQKNTAAKVNVLLAEFSLIDLPSGNYNLVVEVRDKMNQLINSKKIFFQRNNPKAQVLIEDITTVNVNNTFASRFTDRDSLMDHIRSLWPISTSLERNFAINQLKGRDLTLMQQYMLGFWLNRNSENPEKEWLKYYEEVKKVNHAFGIPTIKGYATDRGRVYLQYGPPNTRSEFPYESGTLPYEIWHYQLLTDKQSNRKFVFYSPDRVSVNYKLLHSDAQGELRDPGWQAKLGSSAEEQFKNPR